MHILTKTVVLNVTGCRTGRSVNSVHVSLIAILKVLLTVHCIVKYSCCSLSLAEANSLTVTCVIKHFIQPFIADPGMGGPGGRQPPRGPNVWGFLLFKY